MSEGTLVPSFAEHEPVYSPRLAMPPIRILLADDHQRLRDLIHERIIRENDFEVVAVAENSMQAVEAALAQRPRLVLIDPMMIDGLGIDAVRQIHAHLPETIIIVLTAFADTAQKMELRRAGAAHILDKGIVSAQLVKILRQAGSDITTSNHPS